MIGLAFLATVIVYLDRQTLSVLAPVLRQEFGMSNFDYSRVVSAFMVAYTIMNGVSGPLLTAWELAWDTRYAPVGGRLRRFCRLSR